ncbi:Fungal Zn binuclear cluster domain containing protein [Coccidioides posadasii C735 delta SOWgp]|uniref:Fungal Zn binuclear cluster domain containing protein n=1 Tax=Coccidioides posadasii (strain C735) TaxID=222929 RepID=C5PCV8_COCP7|nr:Fungal Zn binuclear cluster domain containing protein [Coccidioides posadasii C735 delta SOWgp]EER24919.1 Fungal Zn binuclear cluster domain containing protein [Coccidioides posadasii C735 delta SOWgp]|eukprot:XP_003067064.1 Fungal Zn binuclear cluster domain containing protein [Coccidioides posadasii C735 delta SOWgp]
MFGTLHWNSHNNEVEFVERPHGSSNLERTLVCDRCRAKKVKCSPAHDGCGRCKRLGKKCTFASIKHRGSKRIQKASINIPQNEHPPALLTPSSAPSSSEITEHEERLCSDKQPIVSSLPADGNVVAEQGQQLLAELPTDRLTDTPLNIFQSFLAGFDQRARDRDGDNTSNYTLSPSPGFSTILPRTGPESIQPTGARTSENLPSPPLSLGDEMLRYSPSSGQSQDFSLDMGCIATPTSLHISSLASTAFSSENPLGKSCRCLAAVIFAVEEFEASYNPGNRAELDSIIAYQKEAIKFCRSKFKCSSCMTKRENLVLLVFMAERLVAGCGQIVRLYRMKDGDTRAGLVPSSLPSCSPTDGHSYHANVEDRDLATSACSSSPKTDYRHSGQIVSTRTRTSSDWRKLLLGDYEISSPLEWEHLVRVLILLQLRAVMELLADLKNVGSKVLGEAQTANLARAEIRLGELEKDIYRGECSTP